MSENFKMNSDGWLSEMKNTWYKMYLQENNITSNRAIREGGVTNS